MATHKGVGTIKGLAAVFDSTSQNLGGFVEVIDPTAFSRTDMRSAIMAKNHDVDYVVARAENRTLRLKVTRQGLEYEADLGNSTIAADLYDAVSRGDIFQSSFQFSTAKGGDDWTQVDGMSVRRLLDVSFLYDVAPVTRPAYLATTASAGASRAIGSGVKPGLSRRLGDLRLTARSKSVVGVIALRGAPKGVDVKRLGVREIRAYDPDMGLPDVTGALSSLAMRKGVPLAEVRMAAAENRLGEIVKLADRADWLDLVERERRWHR